MLKLMLAVAALLAALTTTSTIGVVDARLPGERTATVTTAP